MKILSATSKNQEVSMDEKATTTICFVAQKELDNALNAIALEAHVSKSDVIRWAIIAYIEDDNRRLEIYESCVNSSG